MVEIVRADSIGSEPGGPGWVRVVLVDAGVGVSAMTLERLVLDPGAEGPDVEGRGRELFLYVVRGSGTATGPDGDLALEPETIVWIEPGDRLRLRARGDGLELLVAEAAGEARDASK